VQSGHLWTFFRGVEALDKLRGDLGSMKQMASRYGALSGTKWSPLRAATRYAIVVDAATQPLPCKINLRVIRPENLAGANSNNSGRAGALTVYDLHRKQPLDNYGPGENASKARG
jgi:hypothetical protein